MKRLLNILTGLDAGTIVCVVLSIGSIGLAFLGAERSGELMSTPPALGFSALVFLLLALRGSLALLKLRFDSALLHLGCALVVGGWLWGQVEAKRIRGAMPDYSTMMMRGMPPAGTSRLKPLKGSMALIDGDERDTLWSGTSLDQFVGRLDFRVKLDRFVIEYYESAEQDRMQGRMPPIKEYRSEVTITESGREPYSKKIRVNYPARIGDYLVYQMSWGESKTVHDQPVVYTVLQFIRDPGLSIVYSGFITLFCGILMYSWRMFALKVKPLSAREA